MAATILVELNNMLHKLSDAAWTSSSYFQHSLAPHIVLFRAFTLVSPQMVSPLLNEYDCPLLTLSKTVFCISSSNVLRSVSVVHECTESCNFKTARVCSKSGKTGHVCNTLVYCHDWNNPIYCYNVFCVY